MDSLSPSHGPLRGNTEVDIFGANFRNSSRTYCKFGHDARSVVPMSMFVSSTHIRCISPGQIQPGDVEIMISNDGYSSHSKWSSGGAHFTYNKDVPRFDVFPSQAPSLGGSRVRITGNNFVNSTWGPVCRFGSVVVLAQYITSTELLCITPTPHVVGYYPIEISNNNQDFTSHNLPFHFYENMVMERIEPVSGPATVAGTAVHVYGRNFVNSSLLTCRFGPQLVPAMFVRSDLILCRSPSSNFDLTWKDLSTQANRDSDPKHVRNNVQAGSIGWSGGSEKLFPTAHHYPLYLSKLVSLEISNNAQDYTSSGIRFLYQKDAVVDSVFPNSGHDTGTTPIFVSGNHFVNSTSLRCRVGQTISLAQFVTSRLVLCFAPPRSRVEFNHGVNRRRGPRRRNMSHLDAAITQLTWPHTVFVEISNNGIDFTSNWNTFEYLEPCASGSFCPTHEHTSQYLCPRGTFCPGTGNSNFTLCPKGTYQPKRGQAECLRCPIGYVCPEYGMHVPQICPAGYVCDVTGIEVADQLCPPGHFCLEGTATTSTTCGDPNAMSDVLYASKTQAELVSTKRLGHEDETQELVFGARHTACWDNSTDDFGLMTSPYPLRFWMEAHLMPISSDEPFTPQRGRYCLDDRCLRLLDAEDLVVDDYAFDYSSSSFALRRPVPCSEGTYCHAGTAVDVSNMANFSTPQPCFENMYCPEGSETPHGMGLCPEGFYCPFSKKIPCPVGTYCPRPGRHDPLPCRPGTFNAMVGQFECTSCPRGYICPGFGRIHPAICPPGYICSRTELTSPNIRCPAGFFCQNGTITSDPFRDDTTLRPYPCSAGTYCVSGVGFPEVVKNDPLHAQNCTEGFYCEAASVSPKGSGLCPLGFYCPEGTAVPIPTGKGYFAEKEGTVQPAKCLPGTYAPTIETVKCYPCPPGMDCENDGMNEGRICSPGTYRHMVEDEGILCMGCPQGTWSKQWELQDVSECVPCPPGVVCPIDGMTQPCTTVDLPTPWEPTKNEESPYECSIKGDRYRFGYLDPNRPWAIDSKGRGPYLVPSTFGQCFYNKQANGTVLYQRMRDYYGPLFNLQEGYDHQGYGNETYRGYYGLGSLAISLPYSNEFKNARNCTPGYALFEETIQADRWFPGQCEADHVCNVEGKPQAEACSEGYVCFERTTASSSLSYLCPAGYVCDYGTTPDISLESPSGMLNDLCDEGYYCPAGTGAGQQHRNICPAGYFCPTGTSNPYEGTIAKDSVLRNLEESDADPQIRGDPMDPTLTFLHLPGVDLPAYYGSHDIRCFKGIEEVITVFKVLKSCSATLGCAEDETDDEESMESLLNVTVGEEVPVGRFKRRMYNEDTDTTTYEYYDKGAYVTEIVYDNSINATVSVTVTTMPMSMQHEFYVDETEVHNMPNLGLTKLNLAVKGKQILRKIALVETHGNGGGTQRV